MRLVGDPAPFEATIDVVTADGVELVTLRLEGPADAAPPRLAIEWREPLIDTVCVWTTAAGRDKGLAPDWKPTRVHATATSQAPLFCLVSGAGDNRLAAACSDSLHLVELEVGVVEESGEVQCRAAFFGDPPAPARRHQVALRLDRRALPYERVLADVAAWWAAAPGCTPSPVPPAARAPMLSTWYSFHQVLVAAEVEKECRRARELGCEAVIIDDGWQTLDAARGYAFTGDWEPERIPDMAGHVQRIHDAGMQVLLWYSVPFVGMKSRAWQRFSSELLYVMEDRGAGVLDPRYPDVREFLLETWERALVTWNLDGLKLDFVDRFAVMPETPRGAAEGRDHASVMDAVDRLLGDAMNRLSRARTGALLEFRQPYIGPRMRRYGNMFRANDCPADQVRNRISIVDVRLLCGDTACHGDMLMWHPDEPPESAALQLLAVLFAVPQISVRLDRLPPAQLEMLRFWLGFWRQHRSTLLDGALRAASPELNYPLVSAAGPDELVAAAYADTVVALPAALPARVLVVNATRGDRVTLALDVPAPARRLRVRDCCGRLVEDERRDLDAGAHRIAVPPAGLLELERAT
jgi:alpha-galactosidase